MFVSNVLSNYWRKSSSLAKLPCVLGPCKRTSSVVLVLLLSMPLILWGDFFGHHHEYLFCELITTLCVSLRFGATKVSEVTDRIPGSSQFCIQVTEELHVDCTQSFLSLIVIFSLCGVNFSWWIVSVSSSKKLCKSTKKGVASWVLPSVILAQWLVIFW